MSESLKLRVDDKSRRFGRDLHRRLYQQSRWRRDRSGGLRADREWAQKHPSAQPRQGTKIVNSIGISILIEIIEKMLEIDGKLAFCSLTPTIEKTFQIMGLAQYADDLQPTKRQRSTERSCALEPGPRLIGHGFSAGPGTPSQSTV